MKQTVIRVFLVDDHVVVRKGIRALLATETDIEVIGEAEDGEQAIAETDRLQPDVILMDLVMPGMGGVEAIQYINASQPEARILVLTSFATDDLVFPAIKAGALGYLLKDSEPDDLVRAIHQVHRGEPSLHPTIARRLLQETSDSPDASSTSDILTDAEVELLKLVARGLSSEEIAEGIGDADVQVHVNNILTKLHLASRTQAVLYALREGLASFDDVAPNYVKRLLAMVGKDSLSGELSSQRNRKAQSLLAADGREVAYELAMAGEVQASFLPDVLPSTPGWQITATLEPAHETSGDFYDFIPLPDGRLGIVIADVADKGMGAALYMALVRTLIRTYATEYDTQPERVLSVTNRRILMDTNTQLFVTVFYGVLDVSTGTLTYCNAGHNPPYLLGATNSGLVQSLDRTGIILGQFDDIPWQQASVELALGDTLVLYTDGLTEAQDQQGRFFDADRLLEIAQANLGHSALTMQDALLNAVHEFVGDDREARRDDLTLVIVMRDP